MKACDLWALRLEVTHWPPPRPALPVRRITSLILVVERTCRFPFARQDWGGFAEIYSVLRNNPTDLSSRFAAACSLQARHGQKTVTARSKRSCNRFKGALRSRHAAQLTDKRSAPSLHSVPLRCSATRTLAESFSLRSISPLVRIPAQVWCIELRRTGACSGK